MPIRRMPPDRQRDCSGIVDGCDRARPVASSPLSGDLRSLQRDVLPTGATSREEIETLLSLDSLGNVDEDWPGYLVTTVGDFVLSTSDPSGSVDADTAAWLVTALSHARPRSAAAIVRAILSEALYIDEILPTFAKRGTKRPVLAGPE